MELSLHEYTLENEDSQLILLRDYGTYLMHRREPNGLFSLYYLWGFYVEVAYRKDYPHLEIVRSFCSTLPLTPYLRKINLEKLLAR